MATKQTQSLSSRFVGATIVPNQELIEAQERLMESLTVSRLWGLKPNLAGEYFATVEAAFLDAEFNVVVLLRGPMGDTKRSYFFDQFWIIKEVGRQ